ncbi:MAG TPA: nicotinate-nucleotide adenylyltransferase [Dehalococcoidales bacterium]|nr:nicotinate-nucleotide adenylyltransferase [Dehalococcoidales bacterium]
MKIGILGGTFDPIHNGHLKIAEAARKKLGLNEVYFMPAAKTPLKEGISISAVEHRVKMVRLAIAGKPRFKLSTIELDRPGLSYTADTIAELRKKLGAETELYFIIGWDSLSQFARWREPDRIIRMCRLVAVPRPGYALPEPKALEAAIPGISESLIVLDKPEIAISATEIRERVARGQSIRRLVPEEVAGYIQKNGLYLR